MNKKISISSILLISAACLSFSQSRVYHIQGHGFFRFMKNGEMEYLRQVTPSVVNGWLGSDGAAFLPRISVPEGCSDFQILPNGKVTANAGGQEINLGRLVIAMFDGGREMGVKGKFFVSSDASQAKFPSEGGAGSILSGSIESLVAKTPVVKIAAQPQETSPTPKRVVPLVSKPAAAEHPVSNQPLADDSATSSEVSPNRHLKVGKSITIFVRPDSTVPDSTFTLGDIADITAPKADLDRLNTLWIGNSPILGYNRRLDSNLIRLRLLGNGFKDGEFQLIQPDSVTVERASQSVSPQDINKAAIEAVQSSAGSQTPFDSTSPVQPVVCAPGKVAITAEDMQPSGRGYYVTLAITVDGKPVASRSVTLMPGIGAVSVKPGDIVSVELQAGSATVTVQGKVMNRAYLGQAVQVKIEGVGTGPTIQQGVLESGSKVEVKL